MSIPKGGAIAALGLLCAAPAVAQPAAAPASPATAPSVAVPIDPVRLALGRELAAAMMPDGTYRRLMSGSFDKMLAGLGGSMMDIPVKEIMRLAGASYADVKAMKPTTLREIAAIIDPAFVQRQQRMTSAVLAGMGDIMGRLEPSLRDGMAEAYARRFTLVELGDTARFFRTPSGRTFASQMMVANLDPAVLERMQAILPQVMAALPDLMKRAQAATADLPPPRTAADLSPEECRKLADLLGIDPAKLNKTAAPKTSQSK